MPKLSAERLAARAVSAQPRAAEKRLAPIIEAATFARVHPDTIRRRISSGQLTGYRFGARIIRVDLDELEALLRPIPTV